MDYSRKDKVKNHETISRKGAKFAKKTETRVRVKAEILKAQNLNGPQTKPQRREGETSNC
jgi:hypothetical protein